MANRTRNSQLPMAAQAAPANLETSAPQGARTVSLSDFTSLSALQIAERLNAESALVSGPNGKAKLCGYLLHALSVGRSKDSKGTLTKYASARGVNVRDIPRQSWQVAVVIGELLGEGAEGSGTVSEAHIIAASVATCSAASAALNRLVKAIEKEAIPEEERAGWTEKIASEVRANAEKLLKEVSDSIPKPAGEEEDEEEKEAEMSPQAKAANLLALAFKGVAVLQFDSEQVSALRSIVALGIRIVKERGRQARIHATETAHAVETPADIPAPAETAQAA